MVGRHKIDGKDFASLVGRSGLMMAAKESISTIGNSRF